MLFYESSSTYEEDSDSGQSVVRDVERDKSLDTNDLSCENREKREFGRWTMILERNQMHMKYVTQVILTFHRNS